MIRAYLAELRWWWRECESPGERALVCALQPVCAVAFLFARLFRL